MAGGTQQSLVEQAAAAYKAAKAHETECGRAQAGTPLGRQYGDAKRAADRAKSTFDGTYDGYAAHMRDNGQTPRSKSSFL